MVSSSLDENWTQVVVNDLIYLELQPFTKTYKHGCHGSIGL